MSTSSPTQTDLTHAGSATLSDSDALPALRDELPSHLAAAQHLLGHEFANPDLLHEALTHASHAEHRVNSNERMEFLGDAILGFVVCEHLHGAFPDLLEGEMTKIKSAVVSRRACAKVTEKLGLTETLRLGKGMTSRAKLPSSVAAAAFESVVAAIYLDAGMDAARGFILDHLSDAIAEAAESTHHSNYKSALQQFAQKHLTNHPTYVLLDEKGPDHAKAFAVAVEIQGRRFSACWAHAKKEAEQLAAHAALEELGVVIADDEGRPHLCTGDQAEQIARRFDPTGPATA